jgi:hypothetical protein
MFRAHHPQAERPNQQIIGEGAYVQNGLMMTPNPVAGDCQRANTVLAHVAEGHEH